MRFHPSSSVPLPLALAHASSITCALLVDVSTATVERV
jgi:hypothetical protein